MKDITTPVPPEEMRKIVQKCLEQAALINYSQLTEYAQIEGFSLNTFQGSTVRSFIYFFWLALSCRLFRYENSEHLPVFLVAPAQRI